MVHEISKKEILQNYFQKDNIEPEHTWPFSINLISKLKYFIGIDWSGIGIDIWNIQRELERPVFYVARGSSKPHMACVKPPKPDGTRHPKYRDIDGIERIQDIASREDFWYCFVNQLKMPNGDKLNEGYHARIISELCLKAAEDKKLNLSLTGIIIDGWFGDKNKYEIVNNLRKKDKDFYKDHIISLNEADRNTRIVSSADSIAYFLREKYIKEGIFFRADRRVYV